VARLCQWLAWGIAGLYAVAVLAIALGAHRIGDVFAETDFYGAYAEGARALQRGVLDPSRYGVVGPGYELALAALGLVVRDLFLAAELLSAAAMVAGLLLWFRILSQRADPRLALVTVALLAANPVFFRYGYSVTNDALAFALQAGALAALLLGQGWRAALAAGALTALAFLTRYNAVALLPAALVAFLAGATLFADRRRAALVFTAGFAALVGPWVAFSLAHGQSFSFQFHHNIAYDVFARARGIAWDDYQKLLQPEFQTLADVIARDPMAVLRRELFNVWDHLRLDARTLLGLPVAVCALAGLGLAWADGTLRRLWPVFLAAGIFFLTLVPIFHSERYSIPLLPAYLTLAAALFASPRLVPAFLGKAGPWLVMGLAAIPIGLSLQATAAQTRRVLDQLPVEVLECADTLREQASPGDRVICRKPHIAFHAGLAAEGFPFTRSLAELAQVAREKGARWLFFSWPEAEMRPDYWYLLDTTAAVPGLTIRHATAPRPAVLFEIGPEFGRDPAWLANDTLRAWHTMRARLRVNPVDVGALRALGRIAFDRGDFFAAREHLERAAQRDPRHPGTWLLLGELALIRNDGTSAETAFQQALALDPGSVEARVGLGWASLVAHKPGQAGNRWRPLVGLTRDPHTLERMIEVFAAFGDSVAVREARAALARLERAR
jgi:tetratricopeptide (TPR) repeat protein